MRRPQLGGTSGRVQWVREQQKTAYQRRFRSCQHAGLTPTVGLTASKHPFTELVFHQGDGPSQAVLVTFGVAGRRWPMRSQLTEREVATEDVEAEGGERFSEGDQQRGVAIAASTVREHQGIARWGGSTVEKTPDGNFAGVVVHKRFCGNTAHRKLSPTFR